MENAPSLAEVTQLTRSELTIQTDKNAAPLDPILECGQFAIRVLPHDPDICLDMAHYHLHAVPYKEVQTCWRRLYVDAALWKVVGTCVKREVDEVGLDDVEKASRQQEKGQDWITNVVKILDMALIMTGAPQREELVELWFSALSGVLDKNQDVPEPPTKGRKLSPSAQSGQHHICFPEVFPETVTQTPVLRFPIPRITCLSLEAFQVRISVQKTQTPIIIKGAIDHWAALSEDDRRWNKPAYLLGHTLGGRRLVPVELGRSYTDAGWGQRILSFGEFMQNYMFHASLQHKRHPNSLEEPGQTGYLAQHDLFSQIPSLRSDICIPDYCYTSPPPLISNISNVKPVPKLEEPLLNAWFGPAGTISPLHTDPYHNMLCQVVGYKYLRLYAPDQTARLHPRGDEEGIDMSNTSMVDLDEAMRLFPTISAFNQRVAITDGASRESDVISDGGDVADEIRNGFEERYPGFKDAAYVEGILGPGDCLYIPTGWWHYVRSLSPSFSVSFWFN